MTDSIIQDTRYLSGRVYYNKKYTRNLGYQLLEKQENTRNGFLQKLITRTEIFLLPAKRTIQLHSPLLSKTNNRNPNRRTSPKSSKQRRNGICKQLYPLRRNQSKELLQEQINYIFTKILIIFTKFL